MMRRQGESTPAILGAFCLAMMISAGSMAQEFKDFSLAKPYVTPELISFQPVDEFDTFYLTVKGPQAIQFEMEFSGLSVPFVETLDADGNFLPDGQYAFELRATPLLSEDIKEALVYARNSGDYSEIEALRATGDLPSRALVQSGYFGIKDGLILVPEERETPSVAYKTDGRDDNAKPGNPSGGNVGGGAGDVGTDDRDTQTEDQVIADDLIVDGSACIGFDCVNGEAFSFDTIRLKENNLRIKFQDTSGGNFPSTDWQLTANDSANGGANRFSIDDITGGRTPFTVEGNAPSHSLYVDDGGRIGAGTSTPSVELHVIDGDSPTLRLQQDGSSGFEPQTWDVSGNETNFFVRDVTGGSLLPLRIRPEAPTNSIFVDTDGDVGLGTASPSDSLHVRGTDGTTKFLVEEASAVTANRTLFSLSNNGDARFDMTSTDAGGSTWELRAGTVIGFEISLDGSGSKEFVIEPSGQVEMGGPADPFFVMETNGDLTIDGTLTELSDVDAKENFEPVNPRDILDKVANLPLSTWNYKDNDDAVRHLGPTAQDFYREFGLGKTETGISGMDVRGVALAAIQGLNTELEERDKTIQALQQQNEELGHRLEALEQLVNTLRERQ